MILGIWLSCPKVGRAIPNKWIYKIQTIGGKPNSQKTRLVDQGYAQKEGIDFQEVFLLVVKMTTLCVLFALITALDLALFQMDVKIAFLHGDLDEELYIQGYAILGKVHLVCKLKRSLYGLKQALAKWYNKFDAIMVKDGLKEAMQTIVRTLKRMKMVPHLFSYCMQMICSWQGRKRAL